MTVSAATARTQAAHRAHPSPPVLREGANGRAVVRLQRLLHERGLNPGKVDGDFGPKTEAAVKRFQAAHHLEASGVVGPRTWDWLEHPKAMEQKWKNAHPTFGIGDQSARIETAERRLKLLGYDPGTVDRTMDAQTASAIKAFRADESSKVKNGLMSTSVREALDKAVSKLRHNPYHSRVKPSKEHRRLDALTATQVQKTFDGQLGLGEGVKGRSVKNVQARLRAAGFDPSRTDGVFDERTAGAVKAFQRASGLMPTGRVDSGTWKKLRDSFLYAKTGTSPAQTIGERSSAVRRSENVLRKLGYKKVKADGTYDARTARAVRAFEKKHHLKRDGKIGTHDLKVMNKTLRLNSTKTVAGCARILLHSKNVSFWSGLSTGSDRKNLERLARGQPAFVPATGGHVKPSLKMMQALVAMSRHGHIMINALTGGVHSVGSNHYRGIAVDMDISTGNAGMIERIARRYGGIRNFERDHIHLDF